MPATSAGVTITPNLIPLQFFVSTRFVHEPVAASVTEAAPIDIVDV
jgi:hypothetical protein